MPPRLPGPGPLALLEASLGMAVRRLAAHWRLTAAAGGGVLLAVALMASGVIYGSALEESALRHTLRTTPPRETNLAVRIFNPLDRDLYASDSRWVQETVLRPLAPYVRDSVQFAQTATFFFRGKPSLEGDDSTRPRGPLLAMERIEAHIRIREGRLPQPGAGLEVMVDAQGAQVLGLRPGDTFFIYPAVTNRPQEAQPVTVVGVFEPTDPNEEFWYTPTDKFTQVGGTWTTVPLWVHPTVLLGEVATRWHGLFTDFLWYVYLNREGLKPAQVAPLKATLLGAIGAVHHQRANGSVQTRLDRILTRYQERVVVARIPLFLLVFLVVGIILYYLSLVGGFLARARAGEVAIVRSRGASRGQVLLMAFLEGAVLAVPALVGGPLLAVGFAMAVGTLFPASGVREVVWSAFSWRVLGLGVLGAFLSALVLALSMLSVSRWSIVDLRLSLARPNPLPFLHRTFLDILLLGLMGMLWWQLRSRGSFLVRPLGGDLHVDLTLLLGPVLGLVAVGLLVLRFFPLFVALLSTVAERRGPVWLVQGFRRAARDPLPSGSLVVLLILAASLGVFGTAFRTTQERSQREQALYEVGADYRIAYTGLERLLSRRPASRALREVPGVAEVSDALRASVGIMSEGFGRSASLLAVDPSTIGLVAWDREGLVGSSLRHRVQVLSTSPPTGGITLPPTATAIGVWAMPGRPLPWARLVARFTDAQGQWFDVVVGGLGYRGWRRLEAPIVPTRLGRLPREEVLPLHPPYTLQALTVVVQRNENEPGAVFLDGIVALGREGEVLLEGFADVQGWSVLEDPSQPGVQTLSMSSASPRTEGKPTALFTWSGGFLGARGIRPGPPAEPIPALFSRTLREAARLEVGERVTASVLSTAVPLRIVGQVDYFPTLYPQEEPFLVVPLQPLIHYLALHAPRLLETTVEAWVRAEPGAHLSPQVLRQALERVGIRPSSIMSAREAMQRRQHDPLLTAGWAGLVLLAFGVTVMASASAISLYLFLDTRAREGEYALLRAIGFTRRQLTGVVWFNFILVVVVGIGLGTWAGHRMASGLLPLLEVAETGRRITPPMVLETHWLGLLAVYGVLALGAGVAAAVLAWVAARLDLQGVLRRGE
ncbi:MAG: FtsX-like permease family protein [Dehalococcoidia bacterium]|nr:FtsX-like permease family protein [Dehalococcoidia bacterium]MDW8120303.1 ABC transporter permease [Chloroflexota bacterium]